MSQKVETFQEKVPSSYDRRLKTFILYKYSFYENNFQERVATIMETVSG